MFTYKVGDLVLYTNDFIPPGKHYVTIENVLSTYVVIKFSNNKILHVSGKNLKKVNQNLKSFL